MKILIAIPSYFPYSPNKVFKSLFDLIYPEDVEFELQFFEGYTVSMARNRAVLYSLEKGFDYTFFVDADVILHENALVNLLAMDKDIATGYYLKKSDKISETILLKKVVGETKLVALSEKKLPAKKYMQVDACGFGCVLVKNAVFQAVLDEQSRVENLVPLCFEYKDYVSWVRSEDVDFCLKAADLKFEIWADLTVKCGHFGNKIY